MSDMAVKNSVGARKALMTRRAFMEATAIVAGRAAFAVTAGFGGAEALAASMAPATGPAAPVVTFDSYFTGWPVYDFSGQAHPWEPPTGRRPGAALETMSDEEFHRLYMSL